MHVKTLALLLLACFLAGCATTPDNPSDNKSSTGSAGAAPRMPSAPMGGGRY